MRPGATWLPSRSTLVKYFALTALVLQGSAASLTTRWCQLHSENSAAPFSNAAVLLCAEVLKLALSLALCCYFENVSLTTMASRLLAWFSTWSHVWKIAGAWGHAHTFVDRSARRIARPLAPRTVPGILYALSNNLGLAAASHIDAPVLQVLYQLKILAAAIVSVLLLGRHPTRLQWAALVALCAGVAGVQLSATPGGGSGGGGVEHPPPHLGSTVLGVAYAVGGVSLGSLAGGWTEWRLKANRRRSVWMLNVQLALVSILLNASILLLSPSDRALILHRGLLAGFSPTVCLLVVLSAAGGLLSALTVRVTDSVTKGVATSVSIGVSAVASAWLFGTQLTALAAGSMALVWTASGTYATGGTSGSLTRWLQRRVHGKRRSQ